MSHCDAEWLALRALGEPVDGPDEAHLAGCAACRHELDQLRAVVSTARRVTAEDRLVGPPPQVWDRVRAELNGVDGAAPSQRHERGAVRWLSERRPRPGRLLAVAAAVTGLLVGSVATALVVGRPSDGTVLATTRLGPLPNQAAAGTAVLSRQSGSEVLTVDVTGLAPSSSAFYEVWLLAPDASRLVALGVLGPSDRGSFELPPGLDVHAYPVVDVSAEPYDGNPAHSADSVVRGTLPI